MRALNLYAGIGGLEVAVPDLEVVAAVDIDVQASEVYRKNFAGPYLNVELATKSVAWFREFECEFWWMSPPCLPFTSRGNRLDDVDPRTQSLLHLIEVVAEVRPPHVLLENVPGFEDSATFLRLRTAWEAVGYRVEARIICPSDFGWPNRRRRVYVYSTMEKFRDWHISPSQCELDLKVFLECDDSADRYYLTQEEISRHGPGLDRVSLDSWNASTMIHENSSRRITSCFGSSYGKSYRGAGSYLQTSRGLRRFSPREVARLLGFPDSFQFPAHFTDRQRWRLLGNSLSIPIVQSVVRSIR